MGTVRLACTNCDREDFDLIEPHEIEFAERLGWFGIRQEQLYQEATEPRNGDGCWWTHLGQCPECAADEVVGDKQAKLERARAKAAAIPDAATAEKKKTPPRPRARKPA